MIRLVFSQVPEGQRDQEAGRALLLRAARACWPQLPPSPTIWKEAGGKPYFPDHPHCYFNLSHSGGWVVCALSDTPVGVDLQVIREKSSPVVRKLTEAEQDWLLTQPPAAFYALWAKKEAYLKYLGVGLTRGLSTFSVLPLAENQVEPGVVCACIRPPMAGFACALCARGTSLGEPIITLEGGL